jgi:hypothetical protein
MPRSKPEGPKRPTFKLKAYNRQQTRKLWDEMLESRTVLRTWCRNSRVYPANLIISVIKHFPYEWEEWKDKLGPIIVKTCEYCKRDFYANVSSQRRCDIRCARNDWIAKNPEYAERKRKADIDRHSKTSIKRRKPPERDLAFPHEENPEG